MTLTNSDLQAIDKIIAKRIEPLENGQRNLEQGQRNLEQGQRKIKKDLKTIINNFDIEYLGLKKRVEKIENKLNIPAPEF